MASKKIRTLKVIFDFRHSFLDFRRSDFRRSDQPLHFQRSDQFKKYFRRSDITYGVKEDQNAESYF
jgi:hypothetical protein